MTAQAWYRRRSQPKARHRRRLYPSASRWRRSFASRRQSPRFHQPGCACWSGCGIRDPDTRRRLPAQLKNLGKLRKMTQEKLAVMVGTKQSAICRIERSQEANWELETLVKMAEALDARLSVVIEPFEAVIARYRSEAVTEHSSAASEPPKNSDQNLDTPSAATDHLPKPAQRPSSIEERHGISCD